MTIETQKETLDFQAEAKQLLQLMIHSLYSNKEIFLRELIANASDASDKLRFEALSDEALYEQDTDLTIDVEFDKEARTITVRDNGIGMSRQEVMDHIGTIAKSGTRQFFESLTGDQSKDSQLIGQFGVGFYSTFIVADKVQIRTRRAGLSSEHGVSWESDGQGAYTLENIEKPERGSEVILYLREGEDELLDNYRLRHIIKKYSDHINMPIRMRAVEVPSGEDEKEQEADTEKVAELETVNQASALWSRAKKDITEEEYNEFYKHVSHDFEDPLAYTHNHVEGTQSYTTLLYIPKRAPFDLWDREQRHGVKLYVRRMFIMDDAEQLMPQYLRFIRGVVDSDDLPLNVSREILQHNKLIDSIRGASVKKVLGVLEKLAKDEPETYATFWKEFGTVLKEGPSEDYANKDKIAKLFRFASTHNDTDTQNVSLDEYIERMQPGQKTIYYVTADSFAATKSSPHLEIFRKKGIEVLLLHERVDEWMISHLSEYDDKKLQSIAKGELDLGDLKDKEDEEQREKAEGEYKDLVERMTKALESKVKEVRVSQRLTESPSCLVVEQTDMAVSMQKLLKQAGHQLPDNKPSLEINTDHPFIDKLQHEKDDDQFQDWSNLLFEQALLSEGGQLEDPAAFVKRLNQLMLHLGSDQ